MSDLLVEFYEYFIHDLNSQNSVVYKFGELTDSDDKECGTVGIEGSLKTDVKSLSSCDPIKSLNGGVIPSSIDKDRNLSSYDLDNIYNNYKNLLVKFQTDELLNKSSIINIEKNLNEAYNKQKSYLNKLNVDDIREYIDNNETKNLDELKESNENDSIILKVQLTESDKVILIGDLHGSFHAFFRILCRLHRYDILNLEDFKLKKNFKIVFLGDILDRGSYTLDIVYLILKLINANNTDTELNIIYNRGNHETFSMFDRDGSNDEFGKKFNESTEEYNKFLTNYIKLLNILPSAVLLSVNGNNIWCCHGGFPRIYLNIEFDISQKIILIRDKLLSDDIKWSDFYPILNINDHVRSQRGKDIVQYTTRGTTKFLQKNNIKFIIRGHQDSIGNSFLFNKIDPNPYIISNINKKPKINGLEYNNFTNLMSYGPIARLDLNNFDDKFLRVLTISTNSDKGRNLTSDSFILLRFDIKDNLSDFSMCLKPVEANKIASLLANDTSINKSDLLKKKLENINTILNLLYETLQNNNYNQVLQNTLINIKEIFVYLSTKFDKLKDKLNFIIQNKHIQNVQEKYIINYLEDIEKIINLMKIMFQNVEELIKDNIDSGNVVDELIIMETLEQIDEEYNKIFM